MMMIRPAIYTGRPLAGWPTVPNPSSVALNLPKPPPHAPAHPGRGLALKLYLTIGLIEGNVEDSNEKHIVLKDSPP